MSEVALAVPTSGLGVTGLQMGLPGDTAISSLHFPRVSLVQLFLTPNTPQFAPQEPKGLHSDRSKNKV